MILGLDYSARPGDAATIAAAGYRFVCRYLSPTDWKNITRGEYTDMLAHDVAVVLVWETSARRMLGGRAAGITDAGQALAQARAVGHPDTRPIYFACDFDATPTQQAPINAYLDGVTSVLGVERVGIYGGYWPLSRALDANKARYAWQTRAWSGSNLDPRAGIVQRIGTTVVGGIECDIDEAHHPDYGQNPYQEDDMTPEQEAKLDRVYFELTNRFTTRVPDGGDYTDTIAGYSINGDMYGCLNQRALDKVQAQIAALQAAVAAKSGIDPEQLKQTVDDAVAQHVQITGEVYIGPAEQEASK